MTIKADTFGYMKDGRRLDLISIKNNIGTEIKISNYGCIITSLLVKDKYDKLRDIVLGFDNPEGYLNAPPYLGAAIGRYANRIAGSEFLLNNKTYKLHANNGKNHLHGGRKGFDKVIWNYKIQENNLNLKYLSPDKEEGYPGNLQVDINYSLTDNNELIITFKAVSDKDTIINLTNHSYFNLNGEGSGNILDHQLKINADYYLPTDQKSIPTGELRMVRGTPFDFTQKTTVGRHIEDTDVQLQFAHGYDHNFIINSSNNELKYAATLESEESGIKMNVYTTEPGVQLYTGNFLDGTLKGKSGIYEKQSALCLETQHYPDSPHFPDFPTTILKRGETFRSKTVYKFYV